ncbi:MAG: hypothetical protein ACREXR_14365 [Gammaproteobacteria bacterium]
MPEKVDPVTNEHVLEVRYKPNPRILDHRGRWAEQISEYMGLQHWRIIENRIDIFSDNEVEHAFVGFRNAGFIVVDSPTKNFFPDKAAKLFRFLFGLPDFGTSLHIERLGVRSKFCTPFNGSFEELVHLFSSRYVGLRPQAGTAVGASVRIIDAGALLNCVDKLGNFNTQSGPLARTQISDFFKKNSGFPEIGLFYDIDYFLRPNRKVAEKDVLTNIRDFAAEAWERHERIRCLIVGAESGGEAIA